MVEQPLEVVQERRRRITELEQAARAVLDEVAGLPLTDAEQRLADLLDA